QPELNDVLARSDMRQLKERITHNFTLGPLVREDIAEYIDFRLRAAGYKGAPLFSQPAVTMLAKASIGLTRRINILADKSLLSAYAANKREVTPDEVRAAIEDCEFSSPAPNWKQHKTVMGAVGAACGIAALIWLFASQRPSAPTSSSSVITASDPPVAPAVAAPIAQVQPPIPPAAPAPPPTALAAAPTVALPPGIKLGPLTTQRYNEEQQWLQNANSEHWFIQILAMDIGEEQQIEAILRKISAQLAAEQIRVYLGKRGNTPRIGIIYGEFETQQAATKSIAALPAALQNYHPYARQIKKLR
ncbi:MAG TPA: ATPase, partial [Rhodocyclaceae bacterium]|nr:ATPase [Rhodocyclaceae bacterium]